MDIDVAEMANLFDLDTCELGLIDEDVEWPDKDEDDLPSGDFLTDTVLELDQPDYEGLCLDVKYLIVWFE